MFQVAFDIFFIVYCHPHPPPPEIDLPSRYFDIVPSETEVCKYGLLTKCEVKMAGYWPSSFFACLWTETKSRSINSQKKNEANIQPS